MQPLAYKLLVVRVAMLAVFGVMLAVVPAIRAQETTVPGVTVEGVGMASAEPNIGTLDLGIEAVSTDLQSALDDTLRKIDTITEKLLGLGIDPTDIQNLGIEIVPEEMTDTVSGALTGEHLFHLRDTLRITVRDLSAMETLISTAVSNGANRIDNFTVGIADWSTLEQAAREAAIASASERAAAIAIEFGLTLGEPIAVSETIANDGLLVPLVAGSVPGAVGSSDSGNLGSLVLVVRTQVVFEIRQPQTISPETPSQ